VLSVLLPVALLVAAVRCGGQRAARVYMLCELGGSLMLYGAQWAGIGKKAGLYAGVWVAVQVLVFYAGQCFGNSRGLFAVGFGAFTTPGAALFIAYLAARSHVSPLPYWVWFALVRGQLEGTLGLATVGKSGTLPRTLGMMWLAQCCYQFTFAVGIVAHRAEWVALNDWLPDLLALAGFGWLAVSKASEL
jgi:hypothetical protein